MNAYLQLLHLPGQGMALTGTYVTCDSSPGLITISSEWLIRQVYFFNYYFLFLAQYPCVYTYFKRPIDLDDKIHKQKSSSEPIEK